MKINFVQGEEMADAELVVDRAREPAVAADPAVEPAILSTILHHIEIDAEVCNQIAIPLANSDLDGYLRDLLEEINEREQKRTYSFAANSTEFFTCLSAFAVSKNFATGSHGDNIANRLLRKEVETDASYGHLSVTGDGHVKKGSFFAVPVHRSRKFNVLGRED